jgi:hypothetical protein
MDVPPQYERPLTDMEQGLLKHNAYRKAKINNLENVMDKRTNFIIDALKNDHTKLKEFYVSCDYWEKGYVMTELKEYTNKNGKTTMKHYVGYRYMNPQPKSKQPVMIGCRMKVTCDNIDCFDIDDKGMLQANEEKFQKHYGIKN